MNDNLNANKSVEIVSLSERESLLRGIAGFSDLSLSELSTLVGLMQEICVNAGEKIVTEGDIVDSIYIIANGSAEVTKQVDTSGKGGVTLLAILNQGECIGLKEAKLFSEIGTRTATVTANVPCMLLRISLTDFHHFLNQYSHVLTNMNKNVDLVLRMQFIKGIAPFAKLSNQRIAWLANLVKEVTFKPHEIIFDQGEKADYCYMIVEGTVEIFVREADGSETIKASLETGKLFGEAALLTNSKRNAAARSLDDCRLMVMDRDILNELMDKQDERPESLISLVMERRQPIRKEGIIYQHRTTADGQELTVLKDPSRNKYFQLTEKGWFVWQQLNGKLTFQEINQLFSKKFGQADPEGVLPIIHTLVEAGFAFVDLQDRTEGSRDDGSKPGEKGFFRRFRFQYLLKKSDKKFDFLYKYGGRLLLTIPVILILLLILFSGFVFFSHECKRCHHLVKRCEQYFFVGHSCGFYHHDAPFIRTIFKSLSYETIWL